MALVHMAEGSRAEGVLAARGLTGLAHVSDREQRLYRAFGLRRGRVAQLAGPRVWWAGLKALLRGHPAGVPRGEDVMQMPGAFLVRHGRIMAAFRHETSADRPDYVRLACGELCGR